MKLLGLSLLLVGLSAFANQQDVYDVQDLAEQVKYAARTSEASSATFQEAKDQLRQVIALLNDTGNPDNDQECIDYAYQKYYMGQSSQAATDSAIAACRKIEDLDVARFLYDKYYMGLSSVAAMDRSADHAGMASSGKLDMIQFAYGKYYLGLSSVAAADRATEALVNVRRGKLSCLESLYQRYYQSMSSVAAMNAAAQGCQ
jgi:hypothetical protein